MSNNVLSDLVAGRLGVTLALVSPARAFHGGGGGMHGGGMGGGMHVGSMGGGMGGGPAFQRKPFRRIIDRTQDGQRLYSVCGCSS